MKIKTNNQPRPIIHADELTDKELLELNLIKQYIRDCYSLFFRYKGQVYCLDDFMVTPQNSQLLSGGWEGYSSITYFCGIVVKYHDNDSIIVGTYYN